MSGPYKVLLIFGNSHIQNMGSPEKALPKRPSCRVRGEPLHIPTCMYMSIYLCIYIYIHIQYVYCCIVAFMYMFLSLDFCFVDMYICIRKHLHMPNTY